MRTSILVAALVITTVFLTALAPTASAGGDCELVEHETRDGGSQPVEDGSGPDGSQGVIITPGAIGDGEQSSGLYIGVGGCDAMTLLECILGKIRIGPEDRIGPDDKNDQERPGTPGPCVHQ